MNGRRSSATLAFKRSVVTRAIAVAFGGFAVASGVALAQDATLQRVEITGSSIKRIAAEGALPVQTVTHEDIEKSGATSVEALMNTVMSNSVVGANTVAQGVGASTYGESAASLRGLGQSKTLVLVNGRRLANYATDGTAVDINSIPLASIDHVEVLLDGASAVYGSDAIGGVINFITRKNFKGVELTAYAGDTKDGGGAVQKAGILVGWGDYEKDRYNLTLAADLGKDSSIYGSQRSYANQSWLNDGSYDGSATPSGAIRTFVPLTTLNDPLIVSQPPGSLATVLNGQGVIPNLLKTQGSGIGGGFGNPLNGPPANCAAAGAAMDSTGALGQNACRYNAAPLVPLVPDVKRSNFSGNFRFKVNDDNELFAEAFFSKQTTTTSEQPSPYSVSFLAPDLKFVSANVYPAIIVNPTSPFYPAAYVAAGDLANQAWNAANPTKPPKETGFTGKPITVSYRAFDGGGRIHTDDATNTHLVFGSRGLFKGYDYDLAYTHNSSTVTESTQQGYQSQLALVQLLSGNDAFNPFTQYQTPALAAQIYGTNYVGTMLSSTLSSDSVNGKISGDLVKLPAGMASFALGGTLNHENLNFTPSAAFQSGDISGYGGQAATLQTSRGSTSVYGELNAPLLKTLEADLALRHDEFQNATSTNPKISLRFQPVSQVLVRASYGEGFRQPSLPELYSPTTFATTAFFTDPVTGVKNQWNQTVGGNPDLKPETSKQNAIGLVIQPTRNLSASIDLWKIKVKDLVTTIGAQAIVQNAANGDPNYTGLVTRSGGIITNITNMNVNAGSVDVAGIDVDLKWQIAKNERGTFSTHLAGTYTSKYDLTLPDGTVQPSVGNTIAPDGTYLTAVSNGGIIFKWKHQLSFDWMYQNTYGLTLTQNYQSAYNDSPRADCNLCDGTEAVHHGAFQTWDVQGTYMGVKNLTLRAGIKNLANKQPPMDVNAGLYFQAGYDPTYYDPHGQFFYMSGTYKF